MIDLLQGSVPLDQLVDLVSDPIDVLASNPHVGYCVWTDQDTDDVQFHRSVGSKWLLCAVHQSITDASSQRAISGSGNAYIIRVTFLAAPVFGYLYRCYLGRTEWAADTSGLNPGLIDRKVWP